MKNGELLHISWHFPIIALDTIIPTIIYVPKVDNAVSKLSSRAVCDDLKVQLSCSAESCVEVVLK